MIKQLLILMIVFLSFFSCTVPDPDTNADLGIENNQSNIEDETDTTEDELLDLSNDVLVEDTLVGKWVNADETVTLTFDIYGEATAHEKGSTLTYYGIYRVRSRYISIDSIYGIGFRINFMTRTEMNVTGVGGHGVSFGVQQMRKVSY